MLSQIGKNEKSKNNQNWAESYVIKAIIALLSLLTAVANLVVAVMKIIEGKTDYAIWSIIAFFVFICMSILGFSLWNVQRNYGIKTNEDYENLICKVSNITHNILHRIRDGMNYMENICFTTQVSDVNEFERLITQEVMQILDIIAEELTELLGTKVRVCIKCFDYSKENFELEEIENKVLITFARSGHRQINEVLQEHKKAINIEKNTDFLEIVNNANNGRQRQFFYEKNLLTYEKELKASGKIYENSNPFWDKDYITTIVCPIRQAIYDKKNNNSSLQYNLKGFLCVDSLDEQAFDNIYADFSLDLIKGIADILYVFLNDFMLYYLLIKMENGVEG